MIKLFYVSGENGIKTKEALDLKVFEDKNFKLMSVFLKYRIKVFSFGIRFQKTA